MATAGVDCHITLQHASVNSGVAVGFILKTDRRGPMLDVERERWGQAVWADLGARRSLVTCIVMGMPKLLVPTGAEYDLTPTQVRAHLTSFWATTTLLTLTSPTLTLSVMWAGDGLEEHVYTDGAEFKLKFVTV